MLIHSKEFTQSPVPDFFKNYKLGLILPIFHQHWLWALQYYVYGQNVLALKHELIIVIYKLLKNIWLSFLLDTASGKNLDPFHLHTLWISSLMSEQCTES